MSTISIINKQIPNFENLPGIIFKCKNDPNWTMFYLSDSFYELTGYEKHEIIENNLISFKEIIHPNDRKFVWESIQDSLIKNKKYSIEYRLIKKNKEVIWVLEQGQGILDDSDQILCIEGYITDISQEVILNKSIFENDKQFKELYEKSPIPYQSLDENGYILSVNQKWLDDLGYNEEEVVGSWFGNYLSDEYKNKFKEFFPIFKNNGEISDIHYSLIKSNGDKIKVSFNGKILKDQNNNFKQTNCIFINITDQEKKEKELFEITEGLKETQKIAKLGNWKWNLNTNQIYWSDEIKEIFGLENKIKNHDIYSKIAKYIHPNDLNSVQNTFENLRNKNEYSNIEFRIIAPNGEIRYLSSKIIRKEIGEDGLPFEIQGIVQDITEIKIINSQLELKDAALSAAGNSIVITDINAVIEWVNPAFEKLTGYSSKQALGKSPKILLKSGNTKREIYTDMWNTINSGNIWRGEFINRRRDGSLYEEHQVITPIKNEKGDITHFIAIKEDITDYKKTENLLKLKTYLQEKLISFGDILNQINSESKLVEEFLELAKDIIDFSKITLYFTSEYINDKTIEKVETYPVFIRKREKISEDSNEFFKIRKYLDKNEEFIEKINQKVDALYLPLTGEGRSIGLIKFEIFNYNELENEKINWLRIITDQTTLAYLNLRNFQKIIKRNAQLISLRELDASINAFDPIEKTIKLIINQLITFLGVDAADILFFNEKHNCLKYFYGYGFNLIDPITQYHKLGFGLPNLVYKKKDLVEFIVPENFDKSSDFFCEKILKENIKQYFGLPIIVDNKVEAIIELFNKKQFFPNPHWYEYFYILASQAEIAIKNHYFILNLENANNSISKSYDITIEGWSKAMDLRDHETEGHTKRVTDLAIEFAKELGLPDFEIENIKRGALLHDIGKIGIPDKILHKPGKLTDEEWQIMKKHPVFAYDMLKNSDYLLSSLDIPYCHHEKWDGSGYPRGLKGAAIPLNARIFAFIDVFDAMTSDRPYRNAMNISDVLDYVENQKGKHFDPSLTDKFVNLIKNKYL